MVYKTMHEMKEWYIAAVRGNLVLHYGLQEQEANKAIEAYRLKERLDKYPEVQLHYDIEDTTEEMKQRGLVQTLK